MGINRVIDHRGKTRIQVSRRWPDGTRFRRYSSNMTAARKTLARLDGAIAGGAWREYKESLDHGCEEYVTVAEFSDIFLEQHCKVRMRSWKRYELSLKTLNPVLGGIQLEHFQRKDLHRYVQRRIKDVKPNTINRDIACVKKMFSFALELGFIDTHPLVRFPVLPVEEKAFRVLTPEEFRRLVDGMDRPSIAAMVAVLGETGMRKSEALHLKWEHVDLQQQLVTVEHTKNRRVRHIPLSPFAVEWLNRTVRYLKDPYVFINPRTESHWVTPDKAFRRGRRKSNLDWVGFHDLRRFRATQWVIQGVDLRTVKELLGHADIKTTMRYAHFAPSHAMSSVRKIQSREWHELSGRKTGQSPQQQKGVSP